MYLLICHLHKFTFDHSSYDLLIFSLLRRELGIWRSWQISAQKPLTARQLCSVTMAPSPTRLSMHATISWTVLEVFRALKNCNRNTNMCHNTFNSGGTLTVKCYCKYISQINWEFMFLHPIQTFPKLEKVHSLKCKEKYLWIRKHKMLIYTYLY